MKILKIFSISDLRTIVYFTCTGMPDLKMVHKRKEVNDKQQEVIPNFVLPGLSLWCQERLLTVRAIGCMLWIWNETKIDLPNKFVVKHACMYLILYNLDMGCDWIFHIMLLILTSTLYIMILILTDTWYW